MGPAACSVGKSRHTAASYAASYSPLAGAVSSAWLSIDGQTVGRCSMLSLRCTNLPRRSNVGSVGQPPLTAACTPLRERPAQPLPPPLACRLHLLLAQPIRQGSFNMADRSVRSTAAT